MVRLDQFAALAYRFHYVLPSGRLYHLHISDDLNIYSDSLT